jgi:hypothetical protein
MDRLPEVDFQTGIWFPARGRPLFTNEGHHNSSGLSPMTLEEKTQILSRIAALEYLLEMGYATWVAQMTDNEIEEFQREFETRLATIWVASQVDPFIGRTEFDTDVIREAQGLAIRFWKRVREREAAIREKRRG